MCLIGPHSTRQHGLLARVLHVTQLSGIGATTPTHLHTHDGHSASRLPRQHGNGALHIARQGRGIETFAVRANKGLELKREKVIQ